MLAARGCILWMAAARKDMTAGVMLELPQVKYLGEVSASCSGRDRNVQDFLGMFLFIARTAVKLAGLFEIKQVNAVRVGVPSHFYH